MHQSPRARDRYILQIYLPSQTRALYVHCVWQASLLSPPASLLGRQIMNGLVVYRCLLLTQRRLAALVRSAQHLTTYPFLPSLSLSSRKGKISGINLNLPPLEANWYRRRQRLRAGGRSCYNILHVRQSCLPLEATATPPTANRPSGGRSGGEDE